MGTSGDVADQVVNMGLNGLEKGINITGKGAERVLAILLATLKDTRNNRGKLKLKSMLKSNKELDIFTIKQTDLKMFTKKAKEYGLPFAVLCSKIVKSSDGVVDLLVRVEDAPKVNRIIDRFKLSIQNKCEMKLSTPEKESENNIQTNGKEDRDEVTEDFINSMLGKTPNKEQPPSQLSESEKNFLSNNSLSTNNMNNNMENTRNMMNFDKGQKKSVKAELAMIKEEQKIKLQENSVKERVTDNFVNELLKTKERGKT